MPKWSSTEIRNQDVHSNGPVLEDTILADPEVKILLHQMDALDFLDKSYYLFSASNNQQALVESSWSRIRIL